jgi:hypothetical protein
LMDSIARHEVFRKELQLFPCVNDTQVIVKPGRIIQVPYPVVQLDSVSMQDYIDSIEIGLSSACNDAVERSFVDGFDAAKKQFAGKTIPVKTGDTLINSIRDQQAERQSQIDISAGQIREAILQGQIIEKDKQITSDVHSRKVIMWWLIGILSVVFGGGIAFAYLKFRNPAGAISVVKKVL